MFKLLYVQNNQLCSGEMCVCVLYIYVYSCAAQSRLQSRHCLAAVGSQCLAHRGLTKPGLFCLSLESRIWQGRNQTISSSSEREIAVIFGFVTLVGPSGCTGEVGGSVTDACPAVGFVSVQLQPESAGK